MRAAQRQGAALEIHYYDQQRHIRVRFALRRFEIGCAATIVVCGLISVLGERLPLSALSQLAVALLRIYGGGA